VAIENIIKVGDIVTVNFHSAQTTLCSEAKVLYTPTQPGDYWILEDTRNGKIYHTNEPCTVSKSYE
jgi:hypothetical protein